MQGIQDHNIGADSSHYTTVSFEVGRGEVVITLLRFRAPKPNVIPPPNIKKRPRDDTFSQCNNNLYDSRYISYEGAGLNYWGSQGALCHSFHRYADPNIDPPPQILESFPKGPRTQIIAFRAHTMNVLVFGA